MLCTIVGVGPGLGASIARRFLAEGYRVAALARDPARLSDWASAQGAALRTFTADAGDVASMTAAMTEVEQWAGASDVLVFNAAAMAPQRVDEVTVDDLLAALRVDAGGLIASLPHVLPAMVERGSGTVLVTGGGLALEPYPEWATLAAGKAALRSLTLSLHKQVAPRGVRVAVVAVCGVVEAGGPFDPDTIAEEYWRLHREPVATGRRELVYLPEGADPFYNDPYGVHRSVSRAVDTSGPTGAT